MGSVGTSLVVRVTDEQGQQSAPKFDNVNTVSLEKTSSDGATAIKLRKTDDSLTKAIDSAVRFKKIGIEFDSKQTLSLKITNEQEEQPAPKFENVDTVYLERISDDGATAITVRKADQSWIKAVDKAVKFKKIGVELEQTGKISGPSVTDADWTSEAWSRKERTIGPNGIDPEDSRVKLLKVGDPSAQAVIGNGECTLRGGSPRLYINGEYQNVEFSTELFVVDNTSQCYLSARSNHEDRPNGFGGYPYYVDITQKKMFFKKEWTHERGYSGRLGTVDVPVEAGKWFKARVRITNAEDGKVKVEGWFNDTVTTSFIDEGQIECGNDNFPKQKYPPFTGHRQVLFFQSKQYRNKGKSKERQSKI